MASDISPVDITWRDCNNTIVDVFPYSEVCKYDESFYGYRISLAANVAFLTIFALSLLGFVAVFVFTRRGVAFTVALVLGCICEVIGYGGRIMSWKNQWDDNGFLMQICCLTMAPAFMAAGLYFTLRRIVYAFGTENSRLKPEWYTRIFIPCDIVSLILQAAGGGMASVASHNNGNIHPGNDTMIAGLCFQVFTMLCFILLATDFGIRTMRRKELDQHPALVRMRASLAFRACLVALALSTFCIFWRCVFRVAELSDGWTGPVMKRQDLFIGMEGTMVAVACVALNIFHPSLCFREVMTGEGGLRSRHRKAVESEIVSSEGASYKA